MLMGSTVLEQRLRANPRKPPVEYLYEIERHVFVAAEYYYCPMHRNTCRTFVTFYPTDNAAVW